MEREQALVVRSVLGEEDAQPEQTLRCDGLGQAYGPRSLPGAVFESEVARVDSPGDRSAARARADRWG